MIEGCDEERLLVMGDFNCRIGDSEDHVDVLMQSRLSPRRLSRDRIINPRGVALRALIYDVGLVVLNGRTPTDPRGDFTFISAQGRSLVDLVLCSPVLLHEIVDGGLLPLTSTSDHFPVHVIVAGHSPRVGQVEEPRAQERLRWIDSRKHHFNFFLQDTLAHKSPPTMSDFAEALRVTADRLGMRSSPRSHPPVDVQPWFNSNCAFLKRCCRAAARAMRANNFDDTDVNNFLFLKRNYLLALRHAKETHYHMLSDDVLSAKDSSAFWKAIRKLTPSSTILYSTLDARCINEHFRLLLSHSTPCSALDYIIPQISVPALDGDISLDELENALRRCKRGKAPGADGVPYEFYVNLNLHNRTWLLNCLNGIMQSESVPTSWSDLRMFLLFKKGDPSIVANYRGITLLNCLAKLFTAIITRRISSWANEKQLIPESQAGFRAGRCCADNLFILQTAIHEHTRTKGNGLFCTFVDFKQAFDKVDHNVLWQKLANFGLSGKLLRILMHFYGQAQVRVSHGNCCTDPINITNGVLQGDCLSPLLFALLVSDFEQFLRQENVDGIGIGPRWEIRCLFYADDLVLLARNLPQMQGALRGLASFCDVNQLTVNTAKTKVIFFRKRDTPHSRPKSDLLLNGVPLEIAQECAYLGIIFSRNGSFSAHENDIHRKAQIASAPIRQILSRLTTCSRDNEYRLFQSKISSVILYGAESWAPWSGDALEKIQLQYYKRLFFLHTSTPGYVIRHLFGLRPMICAVVEKCLRWYNRVVSMEEHRWPRLCLIRLIQRSGDPRFNWWSQINYILRSAETHLIIDPLTDLVNVEETLARLEAHYAQSDYDHCLKSSYCPLYGSIVAKGSKIPLPAFSLGELRVHLQVLLHNIWFQPLYWRGKSASITPTRPCPCCRAGRSDTFEHMIAYCPALAGARGVAGLPVGVPLSELLTGESTVQKVVSFIRAAWPTRLSKVAASADGQAEGTPTTLLLPTPSHRPT